MQVSILRLLRRLMMLMLRSQLSHDISLRNISSILRRTVGVWAVLLGCCTMLMFPAAASAQLLATAPVLQSTLPTSYRLSEQRSDRYDGQNWLAQADQVIEGKPDADDPSFDLNEAADKAEEASDKVYQGLEDTQKLYGKDQKPIHNTIEGARDRASNKWQNLADKARAAEKDDSVSLTPAEKHILKRFVNRQTQQDATKGAASNRMPSGF